MGCWCVKRTCPSECPSCPSTYDVTTVAGYVYYSKVFGFETLVLCICLGVFQHLKYMFRCFNRITSCRPSFNSSFMSYFFIVSFEWYRSFLSHNFLEKLFSIVEVHSPYGTAYLNRVLRGNLKSFPISFSCFSCVLILISIFDLRHCNNSLSKRYEHG